MKVTLNNSCLVKPSEPTWTGFMPLTESDQTGTLIHVPTIYFYKPAQNWLKPKDAIFKTLEGSLSKILVHFYPLAGRLRWLPRARLELHCNGGGVHLIEADCDADMDVLGDFTASHDFHHLIPQINYSNPIQEIPLLCVQLTKFRCGGISLGYTISHAVADGQSALHFFTEWARIACGQPLSTLPVLDRKLLRAGEPPSRQARFQHYSQYFDSPPLLIGESSDENERKKEVVISMLPISKTQVEILKKEANRTRVRDLHRPFTRYEAVSAHIWRCACHARGHVHHQPTRIVISVDVRRRVHPPLPENFFGNAIVDVAASSFSGEVAEKPLGFSAGLIREAIDGVTSEYVDSVIDFLKNLKDFSRLQDINATGTYYGNPNIGVISWMGLPLRGLDFGWGKEIFMGPGNHDGDGDAVVLPGYDGDGSLVVAICLQADHMGDFKKFFYQNIYQTGGVRTLHNAIKDQIDMI